MQDRVQIWERFSRRTTRKRILVIGDVMRDVYLWCDAHSLSQEAPVVIAKQQDRCVTVGGAANAAAGLAALGADVTLVGCIGSGEAGQFVQDELMDLKINWAGVVRGRLTTEKTRIVMGGRQVLRIDQDRKEPAHVQDKLLRALDERLRRDSHFDAVLVSDYAKGVVTRDVMRRLLSWKNEKNGVLVVDPKAMDQSHYALASVNVFPTLLKPNRREAARLCGMSPDSFDIRRDGALLAKDYPVLITAGDSGMFLFETGSSEPDYIAANTDNAVDVTGAGDTVAAVMTLGLCSGLTPLEAAHISSVAAACVVTVEGTHACNMDSIRAGFLSQHERSQLFK